ncbi:MAG: GDSL-type esterase/lipase family protein [Bacilli bacterium]
MLFKNKFYTFIVTSIIIIIILGIINSLFIYKIDKTNKQNSIVFLGDSITYLYPLEEFYKDKNIINSGISGYKTIDILKHLDNMVNKYNPTKVFLLIGTNDMGQGISNDSILKNIKQIVANIDKKNTKIYIESIYPINENKKNYFSYKNKTNKNIQKLNIKLKKYCTLNNIVYIDVYNELLDKKGNMALKYTKDGLHLTNEGYKKVTEILLPYINDD